MSAKSRAKEFDSRERPVEAAASYEEAITATEADIEVYLNLVVLYLVCLDFGYSSYHRLTNEFIKRASSRIPALLAEAERRFGASNEIQFWRYYASYLRGSEPEFQRCLQLAKVGPSRVPYFHVFALPEGSSYEPQAKELLSVVAGGKTEKERYIRSVLQSALNMRKQERKKKASKRLK